MIPNHKYEWHLGLSYLNSRLYLSPPIQFSLPIYPLNFALPHSFTQIISYRKLTLFSLDSAYLSSVIHIAARVISLKPVYVKPYSASHSLENKVPVPAGTPASLALLHVPDSLGFPMPPHGFMQLALCVFPQSREPCPTCKQSKLLLIH